MSEVQLVFFYHNRNQRYCLIYERHLASCFMQRESELDIVEMEIEAIK